MSKKSEILSLIAMGMALSEGGVMAQRPYREKVKTRQPVIKKGLQEFYFDEVGAQVEKEDAWVTLAALNLENAKRKALKLLLP